MEASRFAYYAPKQEQPCCCAAVSAYISFILWNFDKVSIEYKGIFVGDRGRRMLPQILELLTSQYNYR